MTKQDIVAAFIRALGDDPSREGLKNTPNRVVKSWDEIFLGYRMSLDDIFSSPDKSFPAEGYDQMVVLRDVDFVSTCEHHLLPFTGVAHLGYLPSKSGRLIGLSKMARLVDMFSRRLQMQERITEEVANALDRVTRADGVGVRLVATHSCMTCRGVKKSRSTMITTALRGSFHIDGVKAEFFSNIR